MKQYRTIVFEFMNQGYIFPIVCVTWVFPFEFFFHFALQNNFTKFNQFCLPFSEAGQIVIYIFVFHSVRFTLSVFYPFFYLWLIRPPIYPDIVLVLSEDFRFLLSDNRKLHLLSNRHSDLIRQH